MTTVTFEPDDLAFPIHVKLESFLIDSVCLCLRADEADDLWRRLEEALSAYHQAQANYLRSFSYY